jgi:hypothetical protein
MLCFLALNLMLTSWICWEREMFSYWINHKVKDNFNFLVCEKRIDDHVKIDLLLFKNRTCFKLTMLGQF